MTGPEMMLGTLLKVLGVKVDAEQVQEAFDKGKDALPKLVETFQRIEDRLTAIEVKLQSLSVLSLIHI